MRLIPIDRFRAVSGVALCLRTGRGL